MATTVGFDLKRSPAAFPSDDVESSGGSMRSSKYDSQRKKRVSFIQKLKNVFHHSPEKEKSSSPLHQEK